MAPAPTAEDHPPSSARGRAGRLAAPDPAPLLGRPRPPAPVPGPTRGAPDRRRRGGRAALRIPHSARRWSRSGSPPPPPPPPLGVEVVEDWPRWPGTRSWRTLGDPWATRPDGARSYRRAGPAPGPASASPRPHPRDTRSPAAQAQAQVLALVGQRDNGPLDKPPPLA